MDTNAYVGFRLGYSEIVKFLIRADVRKGYVRNPLGIAIKSSVRRLKHLCDNAVEYWPLDISLVNYFDHAGGKNISYFGTPTDFYTKTCILNLIMNYE